MRASSALEHHASATIAVSLDADQPQLLEGKPYVGRWPFPSDEIGIMRYRTLASIIFACAFFGRPALAAQIDPTMFANQMGTLLAAEGLCGLHFKQSAIETYVATKIPADDLTFVSMLSLMVAGRKFQQEQMGASEKTALCTQVSRIAKKLGFIE